jgi:hypothetical protein
MTLLPASVSDAERHAWHYWFVDGLPYLLSGAGCLLAAATPLTKGVVPRLTFAVFSAVAFALALLIYFRMGRILGWLRARLTYPRTGYVSPPYFAEEVRAPLGLTILAIGSVAEQRASEDERIREDWRRRGVLLVFVGSVAALLGGVPQVNRWICLVVGLAASALLRILTRNDDRLSGGVLVGLPFVAVYISMYNVAENARMGFFLIGIGTFLVLEGALRLIRYLRHHPRVQPS